MRLFTPALGLFTPALGLYTPARVAASLSRLRVLPRRHLLLAQRTPSLRPLPPRSSQRGFFSGDAAAAGAGAGAAGAPQLEALAWSLAVATRSTAAAALAQPCVTLDLRLRGAPPPGGGALGAGGGEPPVWHEKVELTLGQLAVVEASLREALEALDKA